MSPDEQPFRLPIWPNHTFGRLSAVESFVATAPQPPTFAEIAASFLETVEHELEATLRMLVALERVALIDLRYHWVG